MSMPHKRVAGWSLIFLGLCIVLLSPKIVFPGLELLLGIETIVGRKNVIYEPDGSYMFTNPGAMVLWVISVAVVGLLVAGVGASVLYRAHHAVR